MGFNRGPKIITNGLVLALDAGNTRSYPGSGTTFTDLSGFGNNGILTNGPTFISNNNGSIVFDGINDYILLNSSILNNTYTIESWSYLRGNRFTIFSNLNNDSNSKNNQFGTDGNRNIYFQISLNNNTYFYTSSTTNINLNQWYHISFTRIGTVAKIYINSIEINATFIGSSSLDLQPYTSNYVIGRNSSSNYSNGYLSNLKVYNRALTAQEIHQNYNATKSRYDL